MTMTTNAAHFDMPELLEKLNAERQFLSVLQRDQLAIIGRSSDPESRRELACNREEINSVRQAIRELEEQIDAGLEGRHNQNQKGETR